MGIFLKGVYIRKVMTVKGTSDFMENNNEKAMELLLRVGNEYCGYSYDETLDKFSNVKGYNTYLALIRLLDCDTDYPDKHSKKTCCYWVEQYLKRNIKDIDWFVWVVIKAMGKRLNITTEPNSYNYETAFSLIEMFIDTYVYGFDIYKPVD